MNQKNYTERCAELEHVRTESNPYWNAGPETIKAIISCIKDIPECRMLEIGCSNGYTALRLVPSLLEVQGSLFTIESNIERGNRAAENFQYGEVEDVVTLVRGHAPEVFASLSGTFDLVFLDATKYEHVSYVRELLPYLSEKAIVIADNVVSHRIAMEPFVEYMRTLSGFTVEFMEIDTGLLVARKQP